jgi:hypothetical protein
MFVKQVTIVLQDPLQQPKNHARKELIEISLEVKLQLIALLVLQDITAQV